MTERLPESVLNPRLRSVDWRFLLGQEDPPALDGRPAGPGLALVAAPQTAPPGAATLAEVRGPAVRALGRAFDRLAPGGEIRLRWPVPVPGAPWIARRLLERHGFEAVRVHWAWPPGGRAGSPQLWLPVGAPRELDGFLRRRRPRSRAEAAARRVWGWCARIGLLAPLSVLARRPGGAPSDAVERLAGPAASWALLTGGRRSINKVVAVPLAPDGTDAGLVVKFARVAASEDALRREAAVLRMLAADLPAVAGVPRVLGVGRRVGRLAVAESAVHGEPLIARLTPASFPALADRVTAWLAGLIPAAAAQPRETWWPAVAEPLEAFERTFGPVVGASAVERVRDRLTGLPDLPRAVEHRDCSPWNVLLGDDGRPALLDWESADPRGLPALDLVYFLANCAFILERALEAGTTRSVYAQLLDPATGTGAVAAACLRRYCEPLGIDADTLARLRLLCWVIHSRSDHARLRMDAAGGAPTGEALRGSPFLGLVHEELERLP